MITQDLLYYIAMKEMEDRQKQKEKEEKETREDAQKGHPARNHNNSD